MTVITFSDALPSIAASANTIPTAAVNRRTVYRAIAIVLSLLTHAAPPIGDLVNRYALDAPAILFISPSASLPGSVSNPLAPTSRRRHERMRSKSALVNVPSRRCSNNAPRRLALLWPFEYGTVFKRPPFRCCRLFWRPSKHRARSTTIPLRFDPTGRRIQARICLPNNEHNGVMLPCIVADRCR